MRQKCLSIDELSPASGYKLTLSGYAEVDRQFEFEHNVASDVAMF